MQRKGIVDPFPEHGRVFVFCNGGHELLFISSDDWMNRNFTAGQKFVFQCTMVHKK
ncbi:MAG: hypothetical protein ABJC98_22330 [Bacteroidota bacterium]